MEILDRRAAMMLGLSAPAALFPGPAKAEMYARHAGIQFLPGIRRIEVSHCPVSFSGYKSIMIADYVIAPGSGFPREKIRWDSIYHVLEGELRVKRDKEILVSDGGVFSCAAGDWKEDTNIGQLDAVMRVIYLKTR